jgi:hypothetical protein
MNEKKKDYGPKKFKIGKKGSIEENVKNLSEELEVTLRGAPGIEEGEGKKQEEKKGKGGKTQSSESSKLQETEQEEISAENKPFYSSEPGVSYSSEYEFMQAKTKKIKIIIILACVVLLGAFLFLTPLVSYRTPLRKDKDLPQIQVAFKYYLNIFGKKMKEKTFILIGDEKILLPVTMERWVNLDKDKKLLTIKHYRKQ